MRIRDFREKSFFLSVCLAAVVLLVSGFFVYKRIINPYKSRDLVRVGLILDGDQATPYSDNFYNALNEVEREYKGRVETVIKSNVTVDNEEAVIRELVLEKCDIIITNSYGFGDLAKKMAGSYPDIEFIQATQSNANEKPVYKNYHTFMGRIYEGRYIAGQVAGRKLKELIDQGSIRGDQAVAGYVAAYPYPEVISGFTAFYLGMKDQCKEATMKVKYANTWTSYQKEYDLAKELIDEGCVIISQHSDTTGPAVACENSKADHIVFHIGYNQSMTGIAPTTSLVSTRINWTPYLISAVGAVLSGHDIEDDIDGRKTGNDSGAGFDKDWVRMLDINTTIAAAGTEKMVNESIEGFKKGRIHVFRGNYKGVDPDDPKDRIDLTREYIENKDCSAPSFHYILDGIEVE